MMGYKGTKGYILGSVGAVVRQRMEKSKMPEVETGEKTNRQGAWAHPFLVGSYRGTLFSFPRDETYMLQNSQP